jgi:hypothetical protein
MSRSVMRDPSQTRRRHCVPDVYPGRYLERQTTSGMGGTVRNITITEAS